MEDTTATSMGRLAKLCPRDGLAAAAGTAGGGGALSQRLLHYGAGAADA